MRTLLIIALTLFCITPLGYAQNGAVEIPPPEGARGRYTKEQLLSVALGVVRGEILETSARRDEDRYFHRYKILSRDGSVYIVEINSITRGINKIYIESLSADPVLPMAVISRDTAKLFASNYIAEEELGARKPEIRGIVLSVRSQDPVYIVKVKKSGRVYDVVVDAVDGDILEADEAE